jgi:hypothetical protein
MESQFVRGRGGFFVSVVLIACLCPLLGCSAATGQPKGRWYKGNLHTHSLWSDGDDFPERIATWYRDRGYHFLAITDHNTLQQGEKWVKYLDLYKKGAGPATEAYLKAFAGSARTRGERVAGSLEVRLTPFTEYRPMLERPGEFLLLPAEEISDKFEKKPIHVNGTNIVEQIKPKGGKSVVEVIRNDLRAVREQGERLGRPVLPHLNHPNFQWGVTAEEMAEVVEERFFEVYNGHPDVHNLGDATRPGVERMWDIANALRIATFKSAPMLGLGTDDSHHYHVEGASRAAPGRGWIQVRAEALTAEALIGAMEKGDFYASSGVTLADVRYARGAGRLEVEVAPGNEEGERFTTQFVGTLAGADGAPPRPEDVGVVFATVEGRRASYKLTGRELYVRAVVTSDRAPASPSVKGQKRQAWTQPVGWEGRVGAKDQVTSRHSHAH